jgi:predicted patatin/cPLA2 family phospholipase
VEGGLRGSSEVLDVVRRRAAEGSRPGARADGYAVALVIEGGGSRGTVTGGMAMALHELGLREAFDDVYGASAGAISGAWFTSSTPEKLVGWTEPAYMKMLIRHHGPLTRRPVVDVKTLVEVVYVEHAPMDFASIVVSPIRWHPLATDAHTGESIDLHPYVREPSDVQLAIRASAAMPLLAGGAVDMAGRHFFDAGVSEPLPFRTAIAQGATHVLVLRSRRPHDTPKSSRATRHVVARTALRGHGHGFRHALLDSTRQYVVDDGILNGRFPTAHFWPPIAAIRPSVDSPKVSRLASRGDVLEAAFAAGEAAVRAVFAADDRAEGQVAPATG